MPVTTRQQARLLAAHPPPLPHQQDQQLRENIDPPSGSFLDPGLPNADRPPSSVSRSEHMARDSERTKLDDLPEEIIDLIAQALRADPSPTTNRHSHEIEVQPDDRPCYCENRDKFSTNLDLADGSIPLSCVSKRLRDVVFNQHRGRHQVVKFCAAFMKESESMSTGLRECVGSLFIKAQLGHSQTSRDTQLAHYLNLFPNIRDLYISWQRQLSETGQALRISNNAHAFENLESLFLNLSKLENRGSTPDDPVDAFKYDFKWAMKELGMIFKHLPAPNLKDLTIYIDGPLIARYIQNQLKFMKLAFKSMNFPQLDSLRLRIDIEVDSPLPDVTIWPKIEMAIESALGRTALPITSIHLIFVLHFYESGYVDQRLFPPTNGPTSISPLIVPGHEQILEFFETLKKACPQLECLFFDLKAYSCVDLDKEATIMFCDVYERDEKENGEEDGNERDGSDGDDTDENENSDDEDFYYGSDYYDDDASNDISGMPNGFVRLSMTSSAGNLRNVAHGINQAAVEYLFETTCFNSDLESE